MADLFKQTVDRGRAIVDRGYSYVEKWECEWTAEKKRDVELSSRVASFGLETPLQPRDSLFGGRMNGLKLHHKV